MVVCDVRRIVPAVDILGDLVHRSRTVQRDACDDVLKTFRLELLHEARHAAALKLEHSNSISRRYHLVHIGIVERDTAEVDIYAVILFDQVSCVLNDGKRSKSQEVKLKKTDALDIRFGKLDDSRIVVDRERCDVRDIRTGYDHARGVRAGIPRKAFYPHGHIDHLFGLGIGIVAFPELGADLERLSKSHAYRERYHLGYLIALCDRHIKHPGDILDCLPCCKRTKRDNMCHAALAILLGHIVYRYLSSLVVEVDIEIRHRHTLDIKESLEHKAVPYRIDICDAYRICNQRTRSRASSRTNGNIVSLGIIDEVPDYQVVIRIAHLVDH